MEAALTSNLVSLRNIKTKTACNFQSITTISFVIPHDLMRGQMGGYAYM